MWRSDPGESLLFPGERKVINFTDGDIIQNEEYPGPALTGTLCSHIIKVAEDVCFVRLDLHSFSLAGPDCTTDWLSVIGAAGGREAVTSLCGDRTGQASK